MASTTADQLLVRISADTRGLTTSLAEAEAASTRSSSMIANAFARTDTAVARSGNGFMSWRGQVQQAGYQFGDLAVQLQMGTNPIIAMTQQGSQLLGVLGPMGAIAGALVAIFGAVAVSLLGLGKDAKSATTELENFNKAVDKTNELLQTAKKRAASGVMKDVTDAIAANVTATLDNSKELNRLLEERDRLTKRISGGESARGVGAAAGQRSAAEAREQLKLVEADIAAAQERGQALAEMNRQIGDPNNYGVNRDAAAKASEENADFVRRISDSLRDSEEQAQRANEQYLTRMADAIRAADEAVEKRNIAVEKYITGLESQAQLEELSGVQKKTQAAILEAQNRLIDEQGNLTRELTDTERSRIEIAVKTKDALAEAAKQQKETQQELGRVGERIFDNLGTAATQLAMTNKTAALDTKAVWLGALADIQIEFLRLAAWNPLKNMLFGTSAPTLGSLGSGGGFLSGLGGLFGNVSDFFNFGSAGVGATSLYNQAIAAGAAFADGGRPDPGKIAMVGEEGPELWVPDAAGTVIPNDVLRKGGGRSNTVSVSINQHFHAGVTEGTLASVLPRLKAETIAAVQELRKRDPAFFGNG